MMERTIAWGDDLSPIVLALALVVTLSYVVFSFRSAKASEGRLENRAMGRWVLISGVAAAILTLLAVLRPATVKAKVSTLGAKVVVLTDRARRMQLRANGQSRWDISTTAERALEKHFKGLRTTLFSFGSEGVAASGTSENRAMEPVSEHSDLTVALEALAGRIDEKPDAIVVVSDGRWVRPDEQASAPSLLLPRALAGAVVHTVSTGDRVPRDASVLSVQTSGSAVAHQPQSFDIVVYCAKELECGALEVTVLEHKKGVAATVLARGEARFAGETTTRLTLDVTLERAGTRIIEVAIASPRGDEIPENDHRLMALDVVRERLRILHVAGRPTYDVRALRMWLKNDLSLDLVSFFILRTDTDDTNSDEETELALIPFPVDELFSEHLPSFDAIILEDIDAERYRLAGYFENLSRYVEQGGGLLLVGGPSAFGGGAYQSSPLERVLPVALVNTERPFDTVEFVPRVTSTGNVARLLQPLRTVLGSRLPSMPGANTLGPAKPKAVVLWEHPLRTALPLKTGGAPGPMPVLAIGEVGDGRVVVLGVDGTYRLAWGRDGLTTAGRAYGALWEGLLGWVMRDKRFESAQGKLVAECIASRPARALIAFAEPLRGRARLEVQRLDASTKPVVSLAQNVDGERGVTFELGPLAEGGYSAQVWAGDEPAARFDFACERGGRAWADSRPDPERLVRLAAANGGMAVTVNEIAQLPRPKSAKVTSFRQVSPWQPPWVWACLSVISLVCHWSLRRFTGLR